jgi:hypothetical protein
VASAPRAGARCNDLCSATLTTGTSAVEIANLSWECLRMHSGAPLLWFARHRMRPNYSPSIAIGRSRLLGFALLSTIAACGGSTEPSTNPIPTVSSVSATAGDSLLLIVNGTGYVATSFAIVNGAPVITRLVSSRRLEARVDIGDARSFSGILSVTNPAPGGGSSQDVPVAWVADPAPAPTLTTVAPSFAVAGADSVVLALTGTGFFRQSTVAVGGVFTVLGVRTTSPTSASVTLPRSVLSSPRVITLTVRNPSPGGGTSAAPSFEVRAPAPVITALRQTSTNVGRASYALVLDGSGFLDSSRVRVNGSNRPTRFLGSGTLEVTLTEADLSDVGTLQITVSNASPGGGTSAAATFNVLGVTPTLSLLPATGATVGGGFTLGVHGAGFTRTSVVRWNGTDLATDFRSGHRLLATVPDALLQAAGTASVNVFSPGPGGGSSSSIPLTIRPFTATAATSMALRVRAVDVAYSNVTRTLFATARATDSLYPNRLVEIDLGSGAVTRSVAIGTDPRLLAMADDDRLLYVGIDGQNAVRRIDVTTFVPGLEIPMIADGFLGSTYAGDIAVLPGRPRSIAVSSYYRGLSPPLAATTIYDDAVPRTRKGPGHTGGSRIEFAGIDSLLFGYNNLHTGFDLFTFGVDATGLGIVRNIGSLITGFGTEIVGASGRIYASDGSVIDAERQSRVGTTSARYSALYVDSALGRAFAMYSGRIDVIDINTFRTLGSVSVAEASGGDFSSATVYRIVRCGEQCLAWADGQSVVVARSAAFGS